MGPYRLLSNDEFEKISNEIKTILHASRDCLRNQGIDTTKNSFDSRDGYFGEAFGVMRGLKVLGYGYFGSDNLDAFEEGTSGEHARYHNLKWWFTQLCDEVLKEENFSYDSKKNTTNECEHCYWKYGKDAKRRKRICFDGKATSVV